MNAIVIEHVPVAELPLAWRKRLEQAGDARVTVRIEAENDTDDQAASPQQNPLFGMWRDRQDMADVAGYMRSIRAARFGADDEAAAGGPGQ